jgi:hypothetical protein
VPPSSANFSFPNQSFLAWYRSPEDCRDGHLCRQTLYDEATASAFFSGLEKPILRTFSQGLQHFITFIESWESAQPSRPSHAAAYPPQPVKRPRAGHAEVGLTVYL